MPPVTAERKPEATFRSPPVTVENAPDATLKPPPVTDACWLAILFAAPATSPP